MPRGKPTYEELQKLYNQSLEEIRRLSRAIIDIRATVNMPELYLDKDWNIVGCSGGFHSLTGALAGLQSGQLHLREFLKEGDFEKIEDCLEKRKVLRKLSYDSDIPWELQYKGPTEKSEIGSTWMQLERHVDNNW